MITNPKPDPLGIDWGAELVPFKKGTVFLKQSSSLEEAFTHIPRKEPDALVLVVRRMTCLVCASVQEAPEDKLFLRTKGHFTPTLQEESLFSHLPRETKVVHLPSARCGKCFG
jgi:hypothetical protein